MAPKRLNNSGTENDDDQPQDKRIKSKPSFASVIGEVMMVKSAESVMNSIEPLLRRVVNEEVERGIQKTMRTMSRSSSLRIQALEPACLKLIFLNQELPVTIFSCNKIFDINGEPLKLALVEKVGDQITPKILPQTLKVEIVVIDGEFPSSDRETWSADEFSRNIIKEREGKRPLITKDVNFITTRGESCVTLGKIEFTDNSSWTRSKKFKLGARVVSETPNGVRVVEALTQPFNVKDQRGESYKKHYPPALEDEVWRLEKIGKDGKLHERLQEAGIHTVQDFLKLFVVDSDKLKKILVGRKAGMSHRMWQTVLKHAKTCNVGNKLYKYRGSNYTILVDATCKIFSITDNFDGGIYSASDFITTNQNERINELVKNAYENWNSLQEVVQGQVNESFLQFQGVDGLVQEVDGGEMMINNTIEMEFGVWDATPQHLL